MYLPIILKIGLAVYRERNSEGSIETAQCHVFVLYLLHLSKEGTGELKIKIILFNVACIVTDNISSQAIL